MKFKSILVLTVLLVLGCKNEKDSSKTDEPEANAPTEDIFRVAINVTFKENDTFSLFYTEDGSTNFTEKPLTLDWGGTGTPQNLVFTLPNGIYPTELRIDLGMNKNQGDIILNSVELSYNSNKRMIAGPELGNFFRPDEQKCSFDAKTGIVKAKVINGVTQFPSLYPQEINLGPEIQKLAK